MSRTYIGPFGRILPILGDNEPEHQPGPLDETRTTMAAYQLPQPSLNFGSDANPGFTDPTRYNTSSSSRRAQELRSTRTELPPVRQLLTPSSHPSIPPSPHLSQQGPDPTQRTTSLIPSHQAALHEQPPPNVGYSYQSSVQDPSPTFQSNDPRNVHAPRGIYESNALQQQPPPASYVPLQTSGAVHYDYSGLPSQVGYPIQPELSQPPHQLLAHQISPQHSNPHQLPQGFPVGPSVQYYQDNPSVQYHTATPASSPSSSERLAISNVKPAPKVVREAVSADEGPVWVYEDGTTVPKTIDGEPVNAQWGITKAGKPRKRLAIACTTCREKKIKCEPAEPKCAQCEKFRRECRYQTAPRNQQSSPETPSHNFQAHNEPVKIERETSNRTILPSVPISPENLGPQTTQGRNASHVTSNFQKSVPNIARIAPLKPPMKKQRSKIGEGRETEPKAKIEYPMPELGSERSSLAHAHVPANQSKKHFTQYDWARDPYDIDAETIKHYMDMYFVHINAATHRIFPRNAFMLWFMNAKLKSPDDLMVIYAMLALGSVFSLRSERKVEGSLFSSIARHATEQRQADYSLQLAQSRILLSLYHFSCGDARLAWDFIGMGLRAAFGLKLNLEEGCQKVHEDDMHGYGLTREALIECRRRTFWSAYIIDRFCGFWPGHPCMLQNMDTFLRLPCEEAFYERQEDSRTPYFDNNFLHSSRCQIGDSSTKPSTMAYLIQISSIWGDVLNHNTRSSQLSALQYVQSYENLYTTTRERLSSWMQCLPTYLRYSPSNMIAATANGSVGIFIKLHTVYHTTVLRLNRHIRHRDLSASTISRNFTDASYHARQVLELLTKIHVPKHSLTPPPFDSSLKKRGDSVKRSSQPEKHTTYYSCSPLSGSTPFSGYAILTAIDTLSAGGSFDPGHLSNMFAAITAGLRVVEELSHCWNSAKGQTKAIRGRLEQLTTAIDAVPMKKETTTKKKAWRCGRRLDISISEDEDVFYDPAELLGSMFFQHLSIDVGEDEVLLVE